MCDSKKEFCYASNCFDNSCCNFINESISSYFRDATTAFATAIPAIISAFPFPTVTTAQATAIAANCATAGTAVAGVPLTPEQAAAVSAISTAFGGLAFGPGAILTPTQIAALNGLCAAFAGLPAGTPISPGTPQSAAQAAFLDAFVGAGNGVGSGASFLAALAAVAAERTARIVALKIKFDDIDRIVLNAFRQLINNECDQKCCESAADAIRVTAINFLRLAITTATTSGVPALPVPVSVPVSVTLSGVAPIPVPGSLQFLFANYDRELEAATRVIISTVLFSQEDCEPCESCDNKIHIKPGRKISRPCKPSYEEKCEEKCNEEGFDNKKYENKKHEKKFEFEPNKHEKKYEFETKKSDDKKYEKKLEDKTCEYEYEHEYEKYEEEKPKCYKKVETAISKAIAIPKKDDCGYPSTSNSWKYEESDLKW